MYATELGIRLGGIENGAEEGEGSFIWFPGHCGQWVSREYLWNLAAKSKVFVSILISQKMMPR